jgi:hypothetical protein
VKTDKRGIVRPRPITGPIRLLAVVLVALGGALGSFTVVQVGAPQAVHATGKSVLIYGPTLNGSPNNEQTLAQAAGYTVTVASTTTWASMTTAQFASYNAIVFGDPSCGGDPSILNTAVADESTWAAAVGGPIVVIGTDPILHQSQSGGQGDQLTAIPITLSDVGFTIWDWTHGGKE